MPPPHLTRASARPQVASLQPLARNQFAQQTHEALRTFILDSDCPNESYIPVQANGKPIHMLVADYAMGVGPEHGLLLTGQHGVGKSTALLYVASTPRPNGILATSETDLTHWIYFDGNREASLLVERSNQLVPCITNAVVRHLTYVMTVYKLSRDEVYRDIFQNDEYFLTPRSLNDHSPGQQAEHVRDALNKDNVLVLNVLLRFFSRRARNSAVVLVLDNLDPLPARIQREAVFLAQSISKACRVRTIVSIRESTAHDLRSIDNDIVAHLIRVHVTAPPVSRVLRSRLERAFKSDAVQNTMVGEGVIRFKLSDATEFSETLTSTLTTPAVSRLLDEISNNSVRDSQSLALQVLESHLIDARRIIRKLSPTEPLAPSLWRGHLPYYVVLKAIMLCNHPIYSPEQSYVPNLFGSPPSTGHIGPFLRPYALHYFRQNMPAELSMTDAAATLASLLLVPLHAVEEEFRWALKSGCLLKSTSPGRARLSKKGSYLMDHLSYDSEYLTHLATDVPLPPESEQIVVAPPINVRDRMVNLGTLMDYLCHAERRCFVHLAGNGKLQAFHTTIGHRGTCRPILQQVARTLESGAYDADEHDGASPIRECARRLSALDSTADVSGIFADHEREV